MKGKRVKEQITNAIKRLRQEIGAIYFASRHKETPLVAKIVAMVVVSYALSPIDLIPEFIPVLGYLDDFILLPAGIALVIRLIPDEILEVSRKKAAQFFEKEQYESKGAALIIVLIWFLVGIGILRGLNVF